MVWDVKPEKENVGLSGPIVHIQAVVFGKLQFQMQAVKTLDVLLLCNRSDSHGGLPATPHGARRKDENKMDTGSDKVVTGAAWHVSG